MGSTLWVVLTLVVYQGLLLGIGFWARRRAGDQQGYFIGDRQLGPWVAALSYAAGSSSAWSILGVSGIAFTQGLSAFWIIPGTLLGHVVVWFKIAPRLHRLSHARQWVTLTDLLAHGMPARTARWVYRLSAVVILVCFTFYIAAQFQGAANTFTATLGFDFYVALLVGVAVVLVYTLWGGFWAVSYTDALQALLMLVVAVVLPVYAVLALDRADWQLILTHTPYWQWTGGASGWFAVGLFLGMFSIGFGPLGQPHLLNRIMAMRRSRDIVLARTVALVWFVVVLVGMYILGVCAHLLLVAPVAAESALFALAGQLLPAVFTGVLIAAVLSAIMSTADSQMLVAAAALQHDLGGWSGRYADRYALAGVTVAAAALALFLTDSIFSRVLFAWQALGAAFGPIVVVRILGWRIRPWAVPVSLLTGFILTVVFYTLPSGPGDVWERGVPFVTAFVTLWLNRTSSVRKER